MVSVIICTYNYGRFIADAIESVLAQSHSDLECFVIDNGSTDNTEEIVGHFDDPRIKYVKQAHSGVSAGRNRALMMCSGKYVCFLDADDKIEKEKLSVAVSFLEKNTDTDLVYSDMRYFRDGEPLRLYFSYACGDGDKPWMKYTSGSGKELAKEMLNGNIMVISSPVFRKDVLKDCGYFDESLQMNEDWDFWMRIVLHGKKIVFHDAPQTRALIRVHHSSLSRDVFRMQVSGLRVLLKNAQAFAAIGLHVHLKTRVDAHLSAIVSSLYGSGDLLKERYEYLVRYGLTGQLARAPFSLKKLMLSWRLRTIR